MSRLTFFVVQLNGIECSTSTHAKKTRNVSELKTTCEFSDLQQTKNREAKRTVRTVSETRYGRISGIGYCVTSVARRLTATSAPEGLQDVAQCSARLTTDSWLAIRTALSPSSSRSLPCCTRKTDGMVPLLEPARAAARRHRTSVTRNWRP